MLLLAGSMAVVIMPAGVVVEGGRACWWLWEGGRGGGTLA